MKHIRIGNVEYKESVSLTGTPYEEIVLWYDNKYYHAQDELIKQGWVQDENGNLHNGPICYEKGVFEGKLRCYTIATITWNKAHDEFDVVSCSTRAFDLDTIDFKDFKRVLNLIKETIQDEEI